MTKEIKEAIRKIVLLEETICLECGLLTIPKAPQDNWEKEFDREYWVEKLPKLVKDELIGFIKLIRQKAKQEVEKDWQTRCKQAKIKTAEVNYEQGKKAGKQEMVRGAEEESWISGDFVDSKHPRVIDLEALKKLI